MSTTPPSAPPAPSTPRVMIDPRLRARRIAVKRDEGRRRLWRLVALAALLGVALLGFAATRTPLLDVDRVSVGGATHTPAELVVEASSIERGTPMTELDLAAAREGVLALPWVQDVRVRRRWPGTVRIDITEREPVVFVLAGGGGFALIDEAGRVLELIDQPPAGVLALADVVAEGPVGSSMDPSVDGALTVARSLPPLLRERVAGVAPTKDRPGEFELRLAHDAVARLGRPDELAAKLVAVATVLDQVDVACLSILDVRVPASPVVTRAC